MLMKVQTWCNLEQATQGWDKRGQRCLRSSKGSRGSKGLSLKAKWILEDGAVPLSSLCCLTVQRYGFFLRFPNIFPTQTDKNGQKWTQTDNGKNFCCIFAARSLTQWSVNKKSHERCRCRCISCLDLALAICESQLSHLTKTNPKRTTSRAYTFQGEKDFNFLKQKKGFAQKNLLIPKLYRRMTFLGQDWSCRGRIKHYDGRQSACFDWSITFLVLDWLCLDWIEYSDGRQSTCSDWKMTFLGQDWSYFGRIQHYDGRHNACSCRIKYFNGRQSACSDRRMTIPGLDWLCRGWIEHSVGRQSTCSDWRMTIPGQDWSCRGRIKHYDGRQSTL